MIPKPLLAVGKSAAIVAGGFVVLNLVGSAALTALRFISEERQKKYALPCMVCKEKGFYMCKLCKGNATIKWTPLYDPVCINPVVCPTCDGNRVQRCLNCLGKCYT